MIYYIKTPNLITMKVISNAQFRVYWRLNGKIMLN